jgi:Fic family protein
MNNLSGYCAIVQIMNITTRQQQIVAALLTGTSSLAELGALSLFHDLTERTLQRDLRELLEHGIVERSGEARATSYAVTSHGVMGVTLSEESLDKLFAEENRPTIRYDFTRLESLQNVRLFSAIEEKQLTHFHEIFHQKLELAPADIIRREHERITIELSWKSSQFEGNTYSLLEAETLIKEGLEAKGKSKDETQMILNHKSALDFSAQHPELFKDNLTAQAVIELHRYLAEGLFDSGIRARGVGITGSVYQPLSNKFKLEEELGRLCEVINSKDSIFEKALLAFTHICYLQAFNDGNKRTGRILANAILYAHGSFPLSLRAVDVNTYKLAILAYYELGILGNAKQVLLAQAKFAAEHYAI